MFSGSNNRILTNRIEQKANEEMEKDTLLAGAEMRSKWWFQEPQRDLLGQNSSNMIPRWGGILALLEVFSS